MGGGGGGWPAASVPVDPRRRVSDVDPARLVARIEVLERRNIVADQDHIAFRANDSQTAAAVSKLTDILNDPRVGLIVELERFRAEVATDRRVFKAWIGGAVGVVSFVFALITIYAPAIQEVLGVHP